MASITPQEIQGFSEYIYNKSGIKLDKSKGYLLEARLKPIIFSLKLSSFAALLTKVTTAKDADLEREIVDAMTTNETFFFRDNTPFDLLKHKIIPELIDRRNLQGGARTIPIRVWSAACSTGQEVYSIAMTLVDLLSAGNKYDIRILGTDISDEAVTKASYGLYNRFEVERGLSVQKKNKYFRAQGDGWRVRDDIRSLVNFKKFNLMQPLTGLGRFDIVFCRNVAIYFSNPDKVRLFKNIAKVMTPDGALIVGGSESLGGIAPDFVSCHYQHGLFYELRDQARSNQKRVPVEKKKQGRPSIQRTKSLSKPKLRGKVSSNHKNKEQLLANIKKELPEIKKTAVKEKKRTEPFINGHPSDDLPTPHNVRDLFGKGGQTKSSLLARISTNQPEQSLVGDILSKNQNQAKSLLAKLANKSQKK